MNLPNTPPDDTLSDPQAEESVVFDDAPDDAIYHDDGSVEIVLGDELVQAPEDMPFDANLAEAMEPYQLKKLATELLELVDEDIQARARRDDQYSEGIKRTGLGNEAPGGAEFSGASKAVHPMLAKGCVDFASRVIKELFPPDGPCRIKVIGEQSEEKLDRAERKKTYMNWQSTDQIKENRDELERLLSQVPLGGAQYKRWWFDPELKRPRTEAVYIDDVFTPYGNSNFYTSPRVTHRQRINRAEFDRRVRTGLYIDIDATDPSYLDPSAESKSQVATDRVEGVDPTSTYYNQDGLRLVYSIEVTRELEFDPAPGRAVPYIIHVDDTSGMVLGVYRNWEEGDEKFEKKQWMSEWPFIPWRGGPAVGLAHLIGSLSGAATGSLRALLDSAHIQNFPGALKLKGAKAAGESKVVSATELVEIEAPAGQLDADIRKLVMPFPFNGPSQTLFVLLEWLTQQGEQVVGVAIDAIKEAGPNMPVGTAQALIEHGSTNYSAIHARLHEAMRADLAIQHRLNKEHLTDREVIAELGELVVSREDFQGPVDVIPVSDPNVFTEAQRFIQLQSVFQLKADPAFAQFFKPEALLRRALKLLQIPDPEGIARLPAEPKRLAPIAENYEVSRSPGADGEKAPLKAYHDQNHVAHLKVHITYATSPLFGAHPLVAPVVMPALLEHCKEHMLMLYQQHAEAATQMMGYVAQAQQLGLDQDEIELYGQMFAEREVATLVGDMIMPGLQKMQEAVQQIAQASAPKPSPDVALVQQTFKEVEFKKLELQGQKAQLEQQGSAEDRQSQEKLAQLATNVQMIMKQQDAAAATMRAEMAEQAKAQQLVLQAMLDNWLGGAATVDEAGNEVTAPSPMSNMLSQLLMNGLQLAMPAIMSDVAGSTPQLQLMMQNVMAQQQQLAETMQQTQQQNAQALAKLTQGLQTVAAQLQPPQQPQQQPQPPQGA